MDFMVIVGILMGVIAVLGGMIVKGANIRIVQKGINAVNQVSETLTGVKTDLGEHYGLDGTVKNILGLMEPSPTPVAENMIEITNLDLPAEISSTNIFTSFLTTGGNVDLSPIFLNVNDIIGVGTEILGYLSTSTFLQTVNSGQDQIIEVGTKSTVTKGIISYSTIYEAAVTLPAGQQEEKQAGVNGIKTETTTYQLDESSGKLSASKVISTKSAQNRIILVGTKDKVVQTEIPYQVVYEATTTLPAGQQEEKQAGVNGIKTETMTYQLDENSSKLSASKKVSAKAGQAQIIQVGIKPKYQVQLVNYQTKYQADETLPYGYQQVLQSGHKGLITTVTTYRVDETGNLLPKVKLIKTNAQVQVIKVGIKPIQKVEERPYLTLYLADDSLVTGLRQEKQIGKKQVILTTIIYSLAIDGQVTSHRQIKILPGQAQIIKVGVKPTSQQTIVPYHIIYQQDGNLELGKQVILQAGKEGLLLKTKAYKLNEDGTLSSYVTTSSLSGIDQVVKVGIKVAMPPTNKKETMVSQSVKSLAQPILVPLVTTIEDKSPEVLPPSTKTVTLALARVDGEIAQNLSKADLGLGNNDRDYQITGLVFKEVDQKLGQSVQKLGTIKAHHPRMLVLDSTVFESK